MHSAIRKLGMFYAVHTFPLLLQICSEGQSSATACGGTNDLPGRIGIVHSGRRESDKQSRATRSNVRARGPLRPIAGHSPVNPLLTVLGPVRTCSPLVPPSHRAHPLVLRAPTSCTRAPLNLSCAARAATPEGRRVLLMGARLAVSIEQAHTSSRDSSKAGPTRRGKMKILL